jgi:hypothetical protein
MEKDGSSGESDTDSTENPVLPFSPCEDLTALFTGQSFPRARFKPRKGNKDTCHIGIPYCQPKSLTGECDKFERDNMRMHVNV